MNVNEDKQHNQNDEKGFQLRVLDPLQQKLIECAAEIVVQEGLEKLTARALAMRAGCATGVIYTRFEDMRSVIFHINYKSFVEVGAEISHQINMNDHPVQRLKDIFDIYIKFATENRNLWQCIFEYEMPDDLRLPSWYLKRIEWLFQYLEAAISEFYPEETPEEISCIARTLFSSIHGVVSIRVEQRLLSAMGSDLNNTVHWVIEKIMSPK